MTKFENEHGNEIAISVTEDDGNIRVWALGPHTEVDHVWTKREAREIHRQLGQLLALSEADQIEHLLFIAAQKT